MRDNEGELVECLTIQRQRSRLGDQAKKNATARERKSDQFLRWLYFNRRALVERDTHPLYDDERIAIDARDKNVAERRLLVETDMSTLLGFQMNVGWKF